MVYTVTFAEGGVHHDVVQAGRTHVSALTVSAAVHSDMVLLAPLRYCNQDLRRDNS